MNYFYKFTEYNFELKIVGIDVQLFVAPSMEIASIMHYKYMLKDYDENVGYVYLGSLNWTISGISLNYESTVYSSDYRFVDAMHNNFEETWNYIDMLNQSLHIKAILSM